MSGAQSVMLEPVLNRVVSSGRITTADRDWFLRAALTETHLSPDVVEQVKQVFDRLKMGLLKVVD